MAARTPSSPAMSPSVFTAARSLAAVMMIVAVSTLNYAWKMLAAIALIPLLYLMRRWITRYLGAARARELREQAAS